jgi:hypothetical protein
MPFSTIPRLDFGAISHKKSMQSIDLLPLVPGLLGARFPAGLRNSLVVEFEHSHDLVAGFVFNAVRFTRASAGDALDKGPRIAGAGHGVFVTPRAARHLLQQILAPHQSDLEFAGDGGAAAHLRAGGGGGGGGGLGGGFVMLPRPADVQVQRNDALPLFHQ